MAVIPPGQEVCGSDIHVPRYWRRLRRYGGIFGKSVDTPHNEIESERGTDKSLSIRVEKMQNHSWKVYAEIV